MQFGAAKNLRFLVLEEDHILLRQSSVQTVRFEWLEVEPVHSVCWRRSDLRQQSSVQRLMGGMRGGEEGRNWETCGWEGQEETG